MQPNQKNDDIEFELDLPSRVLELLDESLDFPDLDVVLVLCLLGQFFMSKWFNHGVFLLKFY